MAMDKKMMIVFATNPSWLSREQFSWLSCEQLDGLSREQFGWLSREQMGWLSYEQLSGLSREQMGWLTNEQFSEMSGGQLSSAAIPSVPGLYSKMWAAMQAGGRCLDQSIFGPTDDPGVNLCSTPMCIAGHTVNLAGERGYALMDVFGFAGAALLIHRASLGDVPPPRYDTYPNEWALAYIEARAAEEIRKD